MITPSQSVCYAYCEPSTVLLYLPIYLLVITISLQFSGISLFKMLQFDQITPARWEVVRALDYGSFESLGSHYLKHFLTLIGTDQTICTKAFLGSFRTPEYCLLLFLILSHKNMFPFLFIIKRNRRGAINGQWGLMGIMEINNHPFNLIIYLH